VRAVQHLDEACALLNSLTTPSASTECIAHVSSAPLASPTSGQLAAKRALEIAAALPSIAGQAAGHR
jgi:hypothetical protein